MDLNVGNLLETHAERAPDTQASEPVPLSYAQKHRQSLSTAALTIAAVVVVLVIVAFSSKTGRRVHVMERY
jgi:hypothetical protein